MQGCVRASVPGQDGVFAESRECFRQLEDWMASEETAGLQRVIEPTPEGWPLILTFDGKGADPDFRREGRRGVARREAPGPPHPRRASSRRGCRPGKKHGRKRTAELAGVYDAASVLRTAGDIISTPAAKRRMKKAQASKLKGSRKPREPQARGKWLTLGLDDIPPSSPAPSTRQNAATSDTAGNGPVLLDGSNTQIEAVTADATARGVTVAIILDFIHVLEYLWKAA